MAVVLMVTPAAAADGVSGVVQDFFEWSVNAQRETGDAFWRAIYGDSWNPDGGFTDGVGADRTELIEKYGVYTDTMQNDLQTVTLVNGGLRYYWPYAEDDVLIRYGELVSSTVDANGITGIFLTTSTASDNYIRTAGSNSNNGPAAFALPYAATCQYGYFAVADFSATIRCSADVENTYDYNQGSSLACPYVDFKWTEDYRNRALGVTVRTWVDIVPISGLGSLTSLDVAEPSRAGSIAGDVYVVNENGEEVVYNDYSVVNETTNIYNDPISGTERPMEDWAYDYIERQYNITLEDGANVTVKYGDENIEIVEGDSIETLNYGSGSSGEGGGEGGGGGSGIGDAIANLFTVLGEIILGLITALINLATKALDALKGLFDLFGQLVETITGFFGGFTDFLAGVFPFLPEETFTIFNFGLILLVAATVFRKFLK